MTDRVVLPRNLIIFGILLPLAVLIGYLLSSPDLTSLATIGLFLCVLTTPIFLRWHHPILVASWNLSIIVFFLPGSLPIWVLAAGISLCLSVLTRIMDKEGRLLHVPSVTWPLLVLGLVVVFTARMAGGWGMRALGSGAFGGKKY